MYTAFYELRQEPFHVTPDPEFLFPSPAHKEALAAIIYGIEQRKGFVAITGEVGVGKTTILRSYLELADRKHLKLIYIYNASLTFDELLTTLFQELEIPERPPTTFLAVNRLHEELIEFYRKNTTVVLIVDEAQNMPVDTLESLRMLSNLETVSEKLIQIVLIGQPEFDEMLQEHRLRQLRQRIAIHARINPLTLEDSIAYLTHRLNRVALSRKPVFTRQAIRMIAEAANGIPRTLNILSDNALITGFGAQTRPVDAKIVREVLSDRRLAPAGRSRRAGWMTGRAVAAAILVVAALGLGAGLLTIADFSTLRLEPIAAFDGVVSRLRDRPRDEARVSAEVTDDAARQSAREASVAQRPSPAPSPPPEPPRTPPRPEPPSASVSSPPAPAVRLPEARLEAPPPSPRVAAPPEPAPPPPPADQAASATVPPASARPAEPPNPRAPAVVPPASRSGDTTLPNRATEPQASPRSVAPPRPSDRPIPLRNDPSNLAALPRGDSTPSSAPRLPAPAAVPPAAPATAVPRPEELAPRPEPLSRTVRFGDNLWTMAEDVYGFVTPTLLRKVQDANPQIRNINVLTPGQAILFPRDPASVSDRPIDIIDFNANRLRAAGRN